MQDPLEIAEALSAAIISRDLEGVEQLYCDETIIWHSYDAVEQDRSESLTFLNIFFEKALEINYTDIRRVRTDEGYVQQHTLHTQLFDGSTFKPRAVCIVAKIKDGKILRIDEYLEPRQVVIPTSGD